MQPYLFPYLGYFQLLHCVDAFWLLDTVSFIKDGWMNRNDLLQDGRRMRFTLPVMAAPQGTPIHGRRYHPKAKQALQRLDRSLRYGYARAPFRARAQGLVAALARHIEQADDAPDFTETTAFALQRSCDALGVQTPIHRVSDLALSPDLRGQDRVIAICRAAGATDYVNMIGGRALYDAADFRAAGIGLRFLQAVCPPHDQGGQEFVPGLSILDLLARLPEDRIAGMLAQGALIPAAP
ncbi:hypothetical protein PSAL_029340 [Pseudooceanicola algae]|uniref:Uncharacterized protein n=2 Tax=Pseudooceanicola algae TaxID=1537215 RepID=A0A418SGC4_9RHOB|nr:hypothetical protein PSAL_029340 [Pseudooceanicola algae]